MDFKLLIYYFIFLITCLLPVKSQNVDKEVLSPECTLKISGLTNVNSFKLTYLANCNAIKILPSVTLEGVYNFQDYKVDMNIPVNCFEADIPEIKSDFIDLVKGKSYPYMHIYITRFNITATAKSYKDSITNVEITLGGVTRIYSIRFHTAFTENELITSGHKKLNIRDFNLEPPKKFFGLIQVKENIDIDFQLFLSSTYFKNNLTYQHK